MHFANLRLLRNNLYDLLSRADTAHGRVLPYSASRNADFPQTYCLTEIFFAKAETRARGLDRMREKGQLAGPLHGLPISFKKTFHVTGTQAALGLWCYLDNEPSKTDSHLVEILVQQGAVPYVKTSEPQLMMVSNQIIHKSHVVQAGAITSSN